MEAIFQMYQFIWFNIMHQSVLGQRGGGLDLSSLPREGELDMMHHPGGRDLTIVVGVS